MAWESVNNLDVNVPDKLNCGIKKVVWSGTAAAKSVPFGMKRGGCIHLIY